jgi:hydrogenase nickel incorporation protein HypA/HybF
LRETSFPASVKVMHEFAIANSVLDAVRTEARLRPGMRVSKVSVRVGDLSGLDPDALSFCFEALVKETELESIVLEIERRPQRNRCPRCDKEFLVVNYETACPACGEATTVFVSGNELELAYLEMEDV